MMRGGGHDAAGGHAVRTGYGGHVGLIEEGEPDIQGLEGDRAQVIICTLELCFFLSGNCKNVQHLGDGQELCDKGLLQPDKIRWLKKSTRNEVQ